VIAPGLTIFCHDFLCIVYTSLNTLAHGVRVHTWWLAAWDIVTLSLPLTLLAASLRPSPIPGVPTYH
jgi:hypothetical protein